MSMECIFIFFYITPVHPFGNSYSQISYQPQETIGNSIPKTIFLTFLSISGVLFLQNFCRNYCMNHNVVSIKENKHANRREIHGKHVLFEFNAPKAYISFMDIIFFSLLLLTVILSLKASFLH